ncbi:MAG: histidinol dehydrogenase, partial [Planctomycetes bacterium]|nr:histidinol dehydrogenase [Planctomycetota bacterium]
MAKALKNLIISSVGSQWHESLNQIHDAVKQTSYFKDGDENDRQLNKILKAVWDRKDQALAEYSEKFDGVPLTSDLFRINADEMIKAHQQIDKDLLASIRRSIANVRSYQEDIFTGKTIDGKVKYTPIERVGICIPGASAPLPSTVIMTAVPAQVAGVKEIVVVSPPRYKGSIHPAILAVCHELEITEIYRVGGAHAVAALAYGTPTIKPVRKIVGPGNTWVQMAKRKVFGYVDIDSIAGPSEVLIIGDDSANAAWVAADMLSQAEHAPGSAVVFTDSQALGDNVLKELEKQVAQLTRSEETIECLNQYSKIIVFKNMDDIIKEANNFAAEHLEIQCGPQSRGIANKIDNAGAIFIGAYSPVAVGDYWAGPSHTLPTGQTARFFSALSSNDFVKSTSIIEYDKEMLEQSADDIIRL